MPPASPADASKERVNIIVERTLWNRVRAAAAEDDRKISSYVSRVLLAHFAAQDAAKPRRRRAPRKAAA
jgi:hypothetical protein